MTNTAQACAVDGELIGFLRVWMTHMTDHNTAAAAQIPIWNSVI